MKRADWKEIVGLVGIAAVVASLIFVGLQVKQLREVTVPNQYQERADAADNDNQIYDTYFETLAPMIAETICGDSVFIERTGLDEQRCEAITDIAEMRCLAVVSPISLSAVVEGKPNEKELRETYALLFRFCMQSMTLMVLDTMDSAEP